MSKANAKHDRQKTKVKVTKRCEYRNLGVHVGLSKVAGHGVFADRDFKKGEYIEVSPAILVSRNPDLLTYTNLSNYVFESENSETYIGLGFTSLYNHDHYPNAEFTVMDYIITIHARRPIVAGQEIFVDYGWDDETMANAGIE